MVLLEILSKSREMFMRYGVKNLTMDDIAKELGMSKKTIYLYVQNKSVLVLKATKAHLKQEIHVLTETKKESPTAVEEMLQMIEYLSVHFREFNTVTYFDLKKYYPDSFVLVDEHRQKHILKIIQTNIERGIGEGNYRKDINAEIVAKMYISSLLNLFDQQLFPAKKFSFYEVYDQFIKHHLFGILSEKGMKRIESSPLSQSYLI
jgi:AcrR family transcriptional regulator